MGMAAGRCAGGALAAGQRHRPPQPRHRRAAGRGPRRRRRSAAQRAAAAPHGPPGRAARMGRRAVRMDSPAQLRRRAPLYARSAGADARPGRADPAARWRHAARLPGLGAGAQPARLCGHSRAGRTAQRAQFRGHLPPLRPHGGIPADRAGPACQRRRWRRAAAPASTATGRRSSQTASRPSSWRAWPIRSCSPTTTRSRACAPTCWLTIGARPARLCSSSVCGRRAPACSTSSGICSARHAAARNRAARACASCRARSTARCAASTTT